MIRLVLAIAVLAFALAFLEQLRASAPLTLTVRPDRFAFLGSDIEIRIRVLTEPDRSDRVLDVVVDGSGDYSRTTRSVNEQTSTQRSIWIRNPAPGLYTITATLCECSEGGCGKTIVVAREQHTTEIIGREGREPGGSAASWSAPRRFWSRSSSR